jgi:hypothetical protein
VAGADGVALLDPDHVVDQGLVEQFRPDSGAQAGNHPPRRLGTERDRADAVDGHDPHPPVPLPEEPGTAHQRAGRAGADEQHVQLRELPGDRRPGGAEVRLPGVAVGVLVEPDESVVGLEQLADPVQPGTEETGDRVGLDDRVDLRAQRLHQPLRGQVAPRVGHTHEVVAAARRDHAQGDAQVARGGFDQYRSRAQQPVTLGGLDHRGRGLQLDRAGEVEALALEEQRAPECRPEIDIEVFLVVFLGSGDDRHGSAPLGCRERSAVAAFEPGRRCLLVTH